MRATVTRAGRRTRRAGGETAVPGPRIARRLSLRRGTACGALPARRVASPVPARAFLACLLAALLSAGPALADGPHFRGYQEPFRHLFAPELYDGIDWPPGQRRPSNRAVPTAEREQNRRVQSALTYFNWNGGTVDGSLGSRWRAAISQYQAAMGFPADGQMDDFEREFLLNSHQRAVASMGMPPYDRIYVLQGPKGLLRAFRNEQLGLPTEAPPVSEPSLSPDRVPLMTTRCNSVAALSVTNGGPATAASLTDANLALDEQFCLARTYAVSEANRLLGAMPGIIPEQVEQVCAGLVPFLKGVTENAGRKAPTQVREEAAAMLAGAGQSPDQLVSTGTICLGTGYRVDDVEMAFASAVMLAAAGQPAVGELVGHHLRLGFGTEANPARGTEWVTEAVAILESGSTPVILPGSTTDRMAVLRAAIGALIQDPMPAMQEGD